MNIKNKLIACICSFVIILGLIPTVAVQAAVKDFNIISETKVTAADAKKWAKSKGATDTFISLADLYWKYAEDCGDVNPAIAYVQAGKETGYGKFGGVLDESYKNPCGMKTSAGGGDYDPNAHKKFNSWDEGVQAHLDHLALYAGANGYPKEGTYDPRHFVTIKGLAKTVNSLGGRWAPSSTYGEEVGKLYMNLMDYSAVDYGNSDNNVNNNISNNDTSGKVEDDEIETNALPNPGTPESKPSAIKADEVIQNSASDSDNKSEDDKPSITSTIGWKLEDENWYYYKSDGTKAIDWIKPDSNWYYLREDGKMATGWLNYNGSWYYLDQNGIMAKGLKIIDNKWYLFNSSGIMSTGIQSSDNKLYYLENSGELSTQEGWISLNNKWYYLEKNGLLKTGWLKENSASYYLQGDGSMVTGLKKIDGKVYLFADGGQMITGWSKINSNWYYFNSTGEMVTGWKLDNDRYYYLYDTGAMAKGWININGTWYHLDNSGAMTTGWIDSNGDSYYLDKSTGRLMTNTTVEGYTLGSDGKKKKASNQSTSNNNSSTNNTVNTPSNNSPSNNNSNNGKKTIVVDAGHDYGKDYGAEKTINGVTYSETVLNMEVAEKLRVELENRGYNVIMTRKAGERPSFASLNESLSYRANVANNANADLYISIHHNSAESTAANGVETLYSSRAQDDSFGGNTNAGRIAESQRLAALINNNIVNKLNLTNRGAKDQNLYVCRNTNMPAVLVECGFITSPEEAARCADSSSQQKLAEAIAEVVAQNY